MDFMRLSSMKAAHVDLVWCRVQEIRVSRSFFARCGIPQALTVRFQESLATPRVAGTEQWYPTSREKRARCGPPIIRGEEKSLRGSYGAVLMPLFLPVPSLHPVQPHRQSPLLRRREQFHRRATFAA